MILGTGRGSRSEILLGTEPRKSSLYPEGTTINGLISEDEDGNLYKLLTGAIQESGWTGPHYPNSSTDTCCFHHHASGYYGPGNARGRFCPQAEMCVEDCADGRCLFETRSDPTEHHNLAAQMPGKVAAMLRRIDMIKQTAFLPVRCTGCDDGFGGRACTVTNSTDGPAGHALETSCAAPAACERAAGLYGGFWGPFVYP